MALDPSSVAPIRDYTWQTAISEVRWEVQATVSGVRRQSDFWRAAFGRMSTDTRLLRERLTVENISGSGADRLPR